MSDFEVVRDALQVETPDYDRQEAGEAALSRIEEQLKASERRADAAVEERQKWEAFTHGLEEQLEAEAEKREEAQRAGLILRERVNELEERLEAAQREAHANFTRLARAERRSDMWEERAKGAGWTDSAPGLVATSTEREGSAEGNDADTGAEVSTPALDAVKLDASTPTLVREAREM